MSTAGTRRTPIGPILAILGGALLVIGSILDWATLDVALAGQTLSESFGGLDGSDGWITLGSGAVAIAVGIVAMSSGGRRVLAILAILAGLVGGGVGLYDAVTAESNSLDEFAEGIGATRGDVDAAIETGELEFELSIGIGLYLAIAGGVLALVGGALQLSGSGTSAPAMPAAASASTFSTPPPAAPVAGEGPPPAPPAPRPPDAPAP